ncbi:condensin complex subunit 1 [Pseudovirgaria hyperparasitica]|uniref:Condensin complex subunit 1 n=1 Tax=Pseudovirgaria hyperparasitica TaxID=470096 RepID=A0A6A6VWX5_9PEZI|nr:condensin complex subunit 1 [Pseudovirgaria hyperparasitica]KAF2753741.1 condensin complex subunit 1 [Pseudovirgaria hyperparasitica]
MADHVDFNISDVLRQYQTDPASVNTPEAPSELIDCENDPDSLTPAIVNGALNPVIDAIAENPEAITRAANFDTLQFLLKIALQIPPTSLSKILDILVSALSSETDAAHADLEADESDTVPHHKQLLEIYGFLLQWTLSAVETKAAEKSAAAPPAKGKGGKGPKTKGANRDGSWDSTAQLQTALDVMSKVLKLKLAKIFHTTSERDTFVGLFTRPVYLVLESETRIKIKETRMHAFRVLCIAIKHHGHGFGAQTSIIQNLSYFEHLSEPMAEFLHILYEQYDYPQLAEDILRELSGKEFNSNDLKGPKSVSTFITKISELAPRLVIKQMTLLAKFLDSESYTLRCAIIEVCGNLIIMLTKQEGSERSEHTEGQINAFFDVLEERFLDVSPYCRCRAIQVYTKLCDMLPFGLYTDRRQNAAELAARSLEDKTSNARRNAIKLLSKLIETHHFRALKNVDDGTLSRHGDQRKPGFETRLRSIEAQIDALRPPVELQEKSSDVDPTLNASMLQDATQMEGIEQQPEPMTAEQLAAAAKKAEEEKETAEKLENLQNFRRYHLDAIKFIVVVEEASATVTQLLSSKNKSEVIEAMDFFQILDAYKIETASVGIRRMLRLIWTKGSSDEGKGVQGHLIDVYKHLFFDAPDSYDPEHAALFVANNMTSLTFGSTPADLTSLEQLLSTMMKAGLISSAVVDKLWQIYSVSKNISKTQRRGAIIILGMLAVADPDIIVKEMERCLKVGLGALGRQDLGLARYTCVALRRINNQARKSDKPTVGSNAPHFAKLSNDHAILICLAAMTEIVSDDKEWFGLAEQAIGAIYALSKFPDVLCSNIIRRKTRYVFQSKATSRPMSRDSDTAMDVDEPETAMPVPREEEKEDIAEEKQKPAMALSQLLFIVGHVAIKQIVHLEQCELDFKKRKAEKEKAAEAAKSERQSLAAVNQSPKKRKPGAKNTATPPPVAQEDKDELDLIGSTTEDDFTDAIAHIRERELLYGDKSLLARFGPMVADICANNTSYADAELQAQAALCLAKLMCVSSQYCEQHLDLLLTILERSKDATVRSNLVVALGDMAVCFNHHIDENTDFLYRRLNDPDGSVKRTCLMTLTFLILAGQVKVKGQLGEIAKCLEDEDRRIADMSRMFFTEFATKDNAVYNNFVDVFSLLSSDSRLDEDAFKKIMKFITGFIEKDKHAKQLANKLASRLPRCETERQWNDVTYALGLLPHKDEEIGKIVTEGFKVVQSAA